MSDYDVIDIELLYLLDPIDGGMWGLYACEATCSDGQVVFGSVQGDGVSFAVETFEAEDDDPV